MVGILVMLSIHLYYEYPINWVQIFSLFVIYKILHLFVNKLTGWGKWSYFMMLNVIFNIQLNQDLLNPTFVGNATLSYMACLLLWLLVMVATGKIKEFDK